VAADMVVVAVDFMAVAAAIRLVVDTAAAAVV
jgi:hypothetical protein